MFITVTHDLSQERELLQTQRSQKDDKEDKVSYHRTSATTKAHTLPVAGSMSQIRDVTIVTKNSSAAPPPPPPPPVSNECKLLMVTVHGFFKCKYVTLLFHSSYLLSICSISDNDTSVRIPTEWYVTSARADLCCKLKEVHSTQS